MSALSNLTAQGWIAVPDSFILMRCDVCAGRTAWFTKLIAPDCSVTALAGVGGARSDVYGIYCAKCA